MQAKETEQRLIQDFEMQINEYIAKVEQQKMQFMQEKADLERISQEQIQQIKKDLEAMSGET